MAMTDVMAMASELGAKPKRADIRGNMSEQWERRELFGGAITAELPARLTDVSDFRPVPDHQEVRCSTPCSSCINHWGCVS